MGWAHVMWETHEECNILHDSNFTSVTLIRCSSCSAAVSGAGEEQEDMCRRYPWKHTSSCNGSRQTGCHLFPRQMEISWSAVTSEGFHSPQLCQTFHLWCVLRRTPSSAWHGWLHTSSSASPDGATTKRKMGLTWTKNDDDFRFLNDPYVFFWLC